MRRAVPDRRRRAAALRIGLLHLAMPALLGAAAAAPAGEPYVPAELEPWREWVLEGHEHRNCPFRYDRTPGGGSDSVCAWPGVLRLAVSGGEARFEQRWRLYTDGWVPLPGDSRHWPEEVRDGGRSLAVVAHEGVPQVYLAGGEHVLTGTLRWMRRPASLPVGAATALVELSIDGRAVRWPERDGDAVRLAERREVREEAASVDVRVYRLLRDGVPMELSSSVVLRVSGPAREALLGRVLPDGFVPMALDSELPARVEGDGRLRVQLRPGRWQVRLRARARQLVDRVVFEPGAGPWAASEVWSYEPAPRLRVTVAEGDEPLDPTQAAVPAEWQALPAFRLLPGAALRIVERRRGASGERSNQLALQRRLWLDFDGGGYTAQDLIGGRMQTGWRLEMAAPFELGSVRVDGDYRLITAGASGGRGVELRERDLSLTALSRAPAGGAMPVTGWLEDFDEVGVTLHLAPGYRLLAAPGADSAPGAWLSRWRLLDYFLALLVVVAFGRVLGTPFGAAALVVMVLTYHEPGAPRWLWLAALAGVALARAAPEGRFRRLARWYRNAALAVLALVAVIFGADQLRLSLYPQLESAVPWAAGSRPGAGPPAAATRVAPAAVRLEAEQALADRAAQMERAPQDSAASTKQVPGEVVVSGTRPAELAAYAPGALLPTGPGVPAWTRNTYRLGWNGPVSAGQSLRLLILTPGPYRVLRVAGVALVGLLLWRLGRAAFFGGGRQRALPAGAAAVVLLAAGAALAPPPAKAELPDSRLLQELQRRLLEPPECAPQCAAVAAAQIGVAADQILVTMTVYTAAAVAVPLPGEDGQWLPREVTVDGAPAGPLWRGDDDRAYVSLGAGVHELRMAGPLQPALDSVSVTFPLVPSRVEVSATGWEVGGVVDGRLGSGALELVRIQTGTGRAAGTVEPGRMPPFAHVQRRLYFDVEWRVETRVFRRAPPSAAFTLEIPLLAGEAVLDEAVRVREGRALASFGTGQASVSWTSRLPVTEELTLTRGDGLPFSESWQLQVSPIWRLDYGGSPLVEPAGEPARWTPEFLPRDGERVDLRVRRPAEIGGATLAFDSVDLRSELGRRSRETVLTLRYRSTRGQQHVLRLPADARVTAVAVDGREQSVRPRDGELSVALPPGEHAVAVRWARETGAAFAARTPAVDVGTAASNVGLVLALPADRWVLLAAGPALGPAVLYWAELAVFVIIAWVLGRSTAVPRGFGHWLLLGLGFSTFSWGVLLLVGLWLFAVAWRERAAMPERPAAYNAVQVLLALATAVVLLVLLVAIPQALLGTPDMHVTGNASRAAMLQWFADRAAGELPAGKVWSVPLWVYKAAILLWALWLTFALIGWLRSAWRAWNTGGIWRGRLQGAGTGPAAGDEPA